MSTRKYAHKTCGSIGSTDVPCRPFNDREFVSYVTRIGHILKAKYCYIYANMLQMLKQYPFSNQNNENLDKIKKYIAFVIGNVFK